MKTARLYGHIDFDGDSFPTVAQQGTRLALKSQSTNRIRHVERMLTLMSTTWVTPWGRPLESEQAGLKCVTPLALVERLPRRVGRRVPCHSAIRSTPGQRYRRCYTQGDTRHEVGAADTAPYRAKCSMPTVTNTAVDVAT